ncbi:ABC transporter ATP-binding protein/permease [Nocardia aurantia]|uniref:ABC transporter ATP-binding protein/permease n=1 Tax=Nocardia aurantia TaxID=2585199 RepID=UPI0029E8004B|nr:ABC transporter ATP-binding protein/permease [Nocardia aurantia]
MERPEATLTESLDWGAVPIESVRWLAIVFVLSTAACGVVGWLALRLTEWGRHFGHVTGAFFRGRTGALTLGYAAVLVLITVVAVKIQVLTSYQGNDMFSALQFAAEAIGRGDRAALNAAGGRFRDSLVVFAVLAVIDVARAQLDYYLGQLFEIRWRRWLTDRMASDWIDDRVYYRSRFLDHPTDNPDQRIQQDVGDMIAMARALSLGALSAVLSVLSFAWILWRLSGPLNVLGAEMPRAMVFLVLVYVLVASLVAFRIGRPLVGLGFRYQAVTAHFRYSLVRLRENAEPIAFYRGEAAEEHGLHARFEEVLRVYRSLVNRTTALIGWNQTATEAAFVVPWLLQAPRFFDGRLTLGDVQQTGAAFGQIQSSLSYFRNNYTTFAAFRATLARLDGLLCDDDRTRRLPRITTRHEPRVVDLAGINLARPDGTRLIENLTLRLTGGDAVVVTGPSGCGKTTLLRALAEMWPYVDGTIGRPADGRVVFSPQMPYLPLGPLHTTVTYPGLPGCLSDGALADALHRVQLDALVPRLHEDANWAMVLSPGEQQRLAFARILLIGPEVAFLDEATSALDPDMEAALYARLRADLPDLVLISTAHRESVVRLHTARLELTGAGSWRYAPISATRS